VECVPALFKRMSAEGSWKLQARKSERLSFSRRKLNQSGHSQRNHHGEFNG